MDHCPASIPKAIAPNVMQDCVGINAHGYSNHTYLFVPPRVHDTWATKPIYPKAYVSGCALTPSTALIAYY